MKRIPQMMLLAVLALLPAAAAAQASPMTRDQVRERVRDSLNRYGTRSDVNATFRQSTKEPYNFVGTMTGLKNIDSLEIVVSVTKSDTIGFRIYPHYNGGYINLDKARDSTGLMRKLLYYTDQNFLFWGADSTHDVFTGYTFTMESGYPEEALLIVLRSIRNSDKFVGEMRPFIDGTTAAP